MKTVVQVKVTLDQTTPAIWRRILAPATATFFDLHHIIQIAMGWTNSHLFEFKIGDYTIGYEDTEADGFEQVADASAVTLDVLVEEGLVFTYLYDLGDYWKHTVTVEHIIEAEPGKIYPVCVEGELNCPPEDCGGIPGFYRILEIVENKKHPEYQSTRSWVGRTYDHKTFNIEKINKELPKYKKYMKHWRE